MNFMTSTLNISKIIANNIIIVLYLYGWAV